MKVKDLVEMLLKLDQEAEIGYPTDDMIPKKIFKFFDKDGWKEENFDKINTRCKSVFETLESGEYSLEECMQSYEVTLDEYNEYLNNI